MYFNVVQSEEEYENLLIWHDIEEILVNFFGGKLKIALVLFSSYMCMKYTGRTLCKQFI